MNCLRMYRRDISVVAVTGASGFIGAHIVRTLLERNFFVKACVRNRNNSKNQFLLDMERSINCGKVRLFSAEMNDFGSYDEAFAGADAVIHAAAVLFLGASQDPQKDMVDPTVNGTLNVLQSVLKCGVRHYIHTSSVAAIVRDDKQLAFDEGDWGNATITTNSYNFAKTEAEKVVWSYSEGKPYTVTCINPSYVLGRPLSKPHVKASPYIFRQALLGNKYPDFMQSVVDVEDVALAHVEAMLCQEASNKRIIVDGDDLAITVNDLVKEAQQLFPQYEWTQLTSPIASAPPIRLFDNTLSKRLLGLKMTRREEVIRKTVEPMLTGWVKIRSNL